MSTFDIEYLPLVMWAVVSILGLIAFSFCVALIVGQMFRAGYEPIENITESGERFQ